VGVCALGTGITAQRTGVREVRTDIVP